MRRLFLIVLTSLFLAAPALAIDLEVSGGKGGGPFRIRCDPGSFITGLEGRAGALFDNFRIQCGSFDPVSRRITPRGAVPITIGTSGGGGPTSASCPGGWAVKRINFTNTWRDGATINDQFVYHINFQCQSPTGPETMGLTYGPSAPMKNPSFFLGGTMMSTDSTQECPPGEFAMGMQGRSGLYVDALGLICEPLPAAPPPPPQVISPNYQPNPTIQPGRPLGKQAIINTLPPAPAPAPTPAPQVATAPPPAPVNHSGFTGAWDSRTDKGWTYAITLRQDGRNVSGSYVAQNGDKGKISGRVKDNVLEFKWEQDGGFKGTGQFALAADGNSFSGVYTSEPNKKITDPRYLQGTWNGTRR